MNLVVTSPRRLFETYGEQGGREVLALTRRLVRTRARRNIPSRLLPIEDGVPGLEVPGVEPEPDQIAAQLSAVAAVLERGGRRLNSVLLVGGPEVVPFDQIANPTPLDGDTIVLSDRRYAGRHREVLPEWSVGRLPGPAGSSAMLARLIRHTMLLHTQPPDGDLLSFGYSAAIWGRSAATVYHEISPQPPLLSPPVVATTLDLTLLDRARFIYCNLHGVRDGPVWYGQATERRSLVVALRPADLQGRHLRGAVVVSEACYGATIGGGRDERSSMALAFLAHGAAGFVGSTAVTYGPIGPPLGEADLVALHFLRAIQTPGITLGAAFDAALRGMLADTMARQTVLDEDDIKTALSFVLYGDPTLVVGAVG
ncbi:MAG: hypothetical protein OHK0022_44230 [Roseiflexaceae bacterium]